MTLIRKIVALLCLLPLLLPGILKSQTQLSGSFVTTLDPKDLQGQWFLNIANTRHWTHAGLSFQFNLSGSKLEETIQYQHHDRVHVSTSRDMQKTPTRFSSVAGGMHPIPDRWYAVAMDAGKEWMIIYRVSGLFRQEAILVISRKSKLEASDKIKIMELINGNLFLKAKSKGILEVAGGV
jgi:hypothetical protein